jgi:hypothetical protein
MKPQRLLATEITENSENILSETTPILAFPLRGKGLLFPLPLRGRDREGVLFVSLCDLCGSFLYEI